MLRDLALGRADAARAATPVAGDIRGDVARKRTLRGDGADEARRQRERRHCLVHVEDLLQQAVGKGQLPKDTDTPLATLALHAYIGGIMNSWVLDPAAFDLEARRRR